MEKIFGSYKEEIIDIGDIKLHVMIFGSGDPLVLLHGFPEFWYAWKDIILLLKEDFKLIVPDLRGYNLSDKPLGVENYKMDILIRDIRRLSQKLNLIQFILCGHDWGGVIAWAFAEKYPDLLKQLIILNAPHPILFRNKIAANKRQRKASGYIFRFLEPNGEKGLYENDYEALKLSVFRTAIKEYDEIDKNKYLKAWSQPGAILGGVNYYRANMGFEDLTGIINVPTLVFHGMKDIFVTPFVLEGLENYVKNLKIIKCEDASHWILHDSPKLVTDKIIEFINK